MNKVHVEWQISENWSRRERLDIVCSYLALYVICYYLGRQHKDVILPV